MTATAARPGRSEDAPPDGAALPVAGPARPGGRRSV